MSIEDKELDEMFHGEEKPLHPNTVHITCGKPTEAISKTENTTTTKPEKKAQKPSEKPVVEQWEPPKPAPNWMDKLKASVFHVLLYGGLSILVFYWNEAGLMDSSIAVPTMCVCTALAGFGVGVNVRCKK